MAATNDTSGNSGGSTGLMDKAINFMTEPLGIGLVAGAVIVLFIVWRFL